MDDTNLTGQLFKGFIFTNIFKTFRFAIQPGKMLIALMAIAVMVFCGILMDLSATVVMAPGARPDDVSEAPGKGLFVAIPPTELHASLSGHEAWLEFTTAYEDLGRQIGVFTALRHFCAARFNSFALELASGNVGHASAHLGMIAQAVWWAARYHTLYTVAYCAVSLFVMAIAGGAICRSAALQFARDERPGLLESLRFSVCRTASFVSAPLWAAGIALLAGVAILLLSLLGNIPFGVGPVAVGVLSPLIIFLGFIVALFLIGLIAGGSLMFPAVAYEGSDGMDAMGRAFGYIYTRPWRAAFYAAVAMLYGTACYLFVRVFILIVLLAARAFTAAAIFTGDSHARTLEGSRLNMIDAIWPVPTFGTMLGPWPNTMAATEWVGAVLVRIPLVVIAAMLPAFLVSFFFSASTIAYAMMRKHVDGEDFDRIFTQADVSEPEPDHK